MLRNQYSPKILYISYSIVFAIFAIYTGLVLISPQKFIYDEVYYMEIAQNFLASRLSQEFIRNISAPTGILYALVHYTFYPATHHQIPAIRFVNIFFLIASFSLIFASFKTIAKQESCLSFLNAIPWLVFPAIGVISCIALTEISAITFFLISTFLLFYAYNDGRWRASLYSILYLVGSGLCLGLSTWGRQNFILTILGAVVIFLPLSRRSTVLALSYLLPVLLVFLYPISLWNGLVPPAVEFVEQGYKFSNLILSLGYLGIFTILLYPKSILSQSRQTLLRVFWVSLALVVFIPGLKYVPSVFLLQSIFGITFTKVIAYLFGLLLTFTSILTLNFIYSRFRFTQNKTDLKFYTYNAIIIVLICFSNVKIVHQFSSRYITLVLPSLVYVMGLSSTLFANGFIYLRLVFSFLMSVLFVLNYYEFLPF